MEVSWNRGTGVPQIIHILIGSSLLINHPLLGSPDVWKSPYLPITKYPSSQQTHVAHFNAGGSLGHDLRRAGVALASKRPICDASHSISHEIYPLYVYIYIYIICVHMCVYVYIYAYAAKKNSVHRILETHDAPSWSPFPRHGSATKTRRRVCTADLDPLGTRWVIRTSDRAWLVVSSFEKNPQLLMKVWWQQLYRWATMPSG